MKNASRYLLPLEMFMGILLLDLGVDGWVGYGYLWAALAAAGQTVAWGLALCGFGFLQFSLAFLEQVAGRGWCDKNLLLSTRLRSGAAFAAVVGWFYVVYLLISARGTETPVFAAMVAVPAVAFSLWIMVTNRKVACLLDPEVPTVQLQQTIVMERKRPAGG